VETPCLAWVSVGSFGGSVGACGKLKLELGGLWGDRYLTTRGGQWERRAAGMHLPFLAQLPAPHLKLCLPAPAPAPPPCLPLPPAPAGENCYLRRCVVDENACIGNNVQVKNGVREADRAADSECGQSWVVVVMGAPVANAGYDKKAGVISYMPSTCSQPSSHRFRCPSPCMLPPPANATLPSHCTLPGGLLQADS
jgi:hypothetical protein